MNHLPHLTKEEILPLALIGLTFIFGLVLQPLLPAQLPTHWDVAGLPTSFVSRDFVLYFGPGLALTLYLVMLRLPHADPLRRNLAASAEAPFWIRLTVVTFLLILHLFFLGASAGVWPAKINAVLTIDFSYLFFMLGHNLPRLKRNYSYGVRTPWTLESNHTWRKTHEMAGRAFILLAVLNLVGVLVPPWSFWLTLFLIIMAAIGLSWYASRVYHKEFPHGAL